MATIPGKKKQSPPANSNTPTIGTTIKFPFSSLVGPGAIALRETMKAKGIELPVGEESALTGKTSLWKSYISLKNENDNLKQPTYRELITAVFTEETVEKSIAAINMKPEAERPAEILKVLRAFIYAFERFLEKARERLDLRERLYNRRDATINTVNAFFSAQNTLEELCQLGCKAFKQYIYEADKILAGRKFATTRKQIEEHFKKDEFAQILDILDGEIQKHSTSAEPPNEELSRKSGKIEKSDSSIVFQDELKKEIKRCAKSLDPILILGETGTGKGYLAKQIFETAKTGKKVFNSINCADFTGSLASDELFGHVKSAFTGATSDRPGIIKKSAGGTLFLDEVGDMDVECRAKLLKFLDSGEIRPVGTDQGEVLSELVRVICATNKPETELLSERADFIYRFKTVIRLPPLRERKDEIPSLIRFFFNAITGKGRGKNSRQGIKRSLRLRACC